jgi:hypothetical protein
MLNQVTYILYIYHWALMKIKEILFDENICSQGGGYEDII